MSFNLSFNSFFKNLLKISPDKLIMLSFIFVILVGTFLLMLPISSRGGLNIGFVDALFTAASATCVTGMSVRNTLFTWSLFGKTVIIILVQIGGLGFLTFVSMIFVFTGKKISLSERLLLSESFSQDSTYGMLRLVRKIVLITAIIESVGAILLAVRFVPEYGWRSGIYKAVFHSISAFCNAGFDLIGSNSFTPFVKDYYLNIVIMLLVTTGGLGFTVWLDLIKLFKTWRKSKRSLYNSAKKLTLQTKIVLLYSTILILSGAVFYFVMEFNNPLTFGPLNVGQKILASFFQSVAFRSAGILTINFDELYYSSQIFAVLLMFIGGSPTGTAGGIKTVTFAVTVISVISIIQGKDKLQAFNRNIPFYILQKTLAVIMLCFFVVISGTMILSLSESGYLYSIGAFKDILFESISATSTVGLTLGITPHLTNIGKITLVLVMFFGRLGPVTIMSSIARRQNKGDKDINYPEEKVII